MLRNLIPPIPLPTVHFQSSLFSPNFPPVAASMVELPIPSTSGAPSKATRSVRVLSLATDDDASSSDEDQSIPSQLDRSGEGLSIYSICYRAC